MRQLSWLIGVLVLSVLTLGCGGKKEQASNDKTPPKKTPAANEKPKKSTTPPTTKKTITNETPPANKAAANTTPTNKPPLNKTATNQPPVNKPALKEDAKTAEKAKTPQATGKKGGGLKGLFGSITGARTAARKMSQVNNLRQVGLAMHTHHDTFRGLPATAIRSKDGKPLLSWRVKLLPFVEQSALYDQFRLDEPWDSPHNKALVAKMPEVYESPLAPANNGTTRLMLIAGKGLPFGGEKGPRFRDIVDGLSQTIMVLYAGTDKAVPWTKPADLEWKDGAPSATLGKIGPEGIMSVMFDGSSITFPANLPADTWKSLVDHRDGKPVNFDQFRR